MLWGLFWVCQNLPAEESPFWRLPIPAQAKAPGFFQDLNPTQCAWCHGEEHQAWQQSVHALSVSKGLLGQLSAYGEGTQEECLHCHAPRADQQALWKEEGLAAKNRMHGVDCATCHVRSPQWYGPRELLATPHGSVKEMTLMRDSQFCAVCHQFDESGLSLNGKPLENTYAEWEGSRYGREGIHCQTCHLPEGRHEFLGIHDAQMTRRGLELQTRRMQNAVSVRARNVGAGHALPTYVTPKIVISVIPLGKREQDLFRYIIQRKVQWDRETGWAEIADTRLAPEASIEFEAPMAPERTAYVTVEVLPDADYHERVYPGLLAFLGNKLPPASRALLTTALQESGNTGYRLYEHHCPPWQGEDFSCLPMVPTTK